MPVIKGLEWTFDTKASLYEKLRPEYAHELYKDIFNYAPISEASNVVEVGIGGGQATLPFLQTGCKLTAVEYGENFTELCKRKFINYPNFSIITGRFENMNFKDETYDLVYSASAFHWVPEEIGYSKVYAMLKRGGVFARFANSPYPDKGNPVLSEDIQKVYAEYYYPYWNKKYERPKEYSVDDAYYRAMIAKNYGFEDIQYKLYHRIRSFSASEYIELLETYSDHSAIEETIRNKFFSKIEETINKHGGQINIYDTMNLQLARKI